jgi:hypothetical protein
VPLAPVLWPCCLLCTSASPSHCAGACCLPAPWPPLLAVLPPLVTPLLYFALLLFGWLLRCEAAQSPPLAAPVLFGLWLPLLFYWLLHCPAPWPKFLAVPLPLAVADPPLVGPRLFGWFLHCLAHQPPSHLGCSVPQPIVWLVVMFPLIIPLPPVHLHLSFVTALSVIRRAAAPAAASAAALAATPAATPAAVPTPTTWYGARVGGPKTL